MEEGFLKKGDVVRFKIYKTIHFMDKVFKDALRKEYVVEEVISVKYNEKVKLKDCSFENIHPSHLELVNPTKEIEKINCNTCAFFENEGELFEKKESKSNGMYVLECTKFSYPIQNCILKNFEGYQKK